MANHNDLENIQGGQADQYYHFTQAEHTALQDFYDGDALATGYVKRLRWRSMTGDDDSWDGRRPREYADAGADTQFTDIHEANGNWYLGVNAVYDPTNDVWNREDTGKNAYLLAVYSRTGMPAEPGEPLTGVAWWVAPSSSNPIDGYTTENDWLLGFMITENRDAVLGGINFEMDGAGYPPFGRVTHISGSDPISDPYSYEGTAKAHMLLMQSAWYGGEEKWQRDPDPDSPGAFFDSAAAGWDEYGSWFWWFFDKDTGYTHGDHWHTSDWVQMARLRINEGTVHGRLDVFRRTNESASAQASFIAQHITEQTSIADGFGAGYAFLIQKKNADPSVMAAIYAVQDGAYNTGKLSFRVASAGSLAERMSLTAAGLLTMNGPIALAGGVTGASPTPRLTFGSYYDNAGDASVSHLDLYGGMYGWGIQAAVFAHISGRDHKFYDYNDLANPLVIFYGIAAGKFVRIAGDLRVEGGDIGLSSDADLLGLAANALTVRGSLGITGNVGFYGTAPIAKPTVSGSRGGNAALASLCSQLASLGLITDSTTA